jgi:hypothetical protein
MNNKGAKYALLFIPWILSLGIQSLPTVSYLIAWLGSFFIFYMTLTGKIKDLPADRSPAEQLMRPIYIVQIIFAGYMCCTSIFYFLNTLGFVYLTQENAFILSDDETLARIAECQRYYCLGHACLVTGMLVFMKYPVKTKYFIRTEKLSNLLLVVACITFPVSLLFLVVPGLIQFYFQFSSLSFIAGTLALAFAIPLQKLFNTLICLALYGFNFYQALTSGYKEPIILSVLILGIFLYPNYKKLVTILFVPGIFLLFVVLPSYVNSFRAQAWSEGESVDNASQAALNSALDADERNDTNWGFLVFRLSEIDMFIQYTKTTPEYIDYYGMTLLQQSAIAVVPRLFWPTKPNTEDLVMQRVYNAGVVNAGSSVSAKPAFIVDAYLSFGTVGIIVFLFVYGAFAQIIAMKAEQLFGGYIFGAALIFSGLFQIFWRGLSVEFLVNTVCWSYVSMFVIFKLLRSRNIIEEH